LKSGGNDEDPGEDKIQASIQACIQVGIELTDGEAMSRGRLCHPVFVAGLKVRREMWGKDGAERQIETAGQQTRNQRNPLACDDLLRSAQVRGRISLCAGSAEGDGA
jgi:hypothetical protein